MSKEKINWQEVALVIGAILLYALFMQNENQKDKIKNLESKLDEANELTDEIRKKLKDMIENNPEIDEDVKKELAEAAILLEIKQESKAVFTLAKIIENLLKRLYKNDEGLKILLKEKNRKSATFEDYLNYAKDRGVINKEDYHYISALKIHRNKEAHELAVFKEKAKLVGCFLAGLSITLVLQKLIKSFDVKQIN